MSQYESTVIINGRFPPSATAPVSQVPGQAPGQPLDQLSPGDRIGPYLIIAKLGDGGMGVVVKAQDTVLNRLVALKVLPAKLCANPDFLKRFRAEAQAQARLTSPYVVNLYNLIELEKGQALVMEYLEGQTLAQRLQGQGRLSPEEAIWVFQQALLGAEEIHRAGIVHRDLKPSNIFITHDNRVKITDFGIAKFMDIPGNEQQHALMGTLLYISPEQINGRHVDYRSDIYTLGISLYEAVAGQLPFRRKTDYALMHAHVQENPPRPRQHQRQIPRGMEQIILKAIEKDPQRRFQSIAEFHSALINYGTGRRATFLGLHIKNPFDGIQRSLTVDSQAPLYSRLAYRQSHGLLAAWRRRLIWPLAGLVLSIAVLAGSILLPSVSSTADAQIAATSDKYAVLRQAWSHD